MAPPALTVTFDIAFQIVTFLEKSRYEIPRNFCLCGRFLAESPTERVNFGDPHSDCPAAKREMCDALRLCKQQLGWGKWSDLDGVMHRLRCVDEDDFRQLMPLDENELDAPIFACKFAQKSGSERVLALANEDGRLVVHDTQGGRERYDKQAHNNAIFDLAWMFQQMKIVTVSGDHTAKLFDVTHSDIQEQQIFSGHLRSVKTVACSRTDGSVFATGGRDGSIIMWDTRAASSSGYLNVPDRFISNSHFVSSKSMSNTPFKKWKKKNVCPHQVISGANSVTGLAFQDDHTLISCGAGDGVIKAWDLRKNYKVCKREPTPKHSLPYPGTSARNGFSNILVDAAGIRLYANCLDNVIYCYNIATYNVKPVMKYTGHLNSTFYVKSDLSSDGRYLVSGSSDQNAYIWNVNQSKPVVKLTGHNAEVTCVAWCCSGEMSVVTCSDDMKHKIWRIGPETLPDNWEVIGCGVAKRIVNSNLKRRHETDPATPYSHKKHLAACSRCDCSTPNSRCCENCNSGNHKRKMNDMPMSECKKPRRLFNPIDLNAPSSSNGADGEALAEVLDKNGKNFIGDLPNFAIDGEAPHLNVSPQKRHEVDWLTKIRYEKTLFKRMNEVTMTLATEQDEESPTPKKILRLDSSPQIGRNKKTPRRSSQCDPHQSHLLKFFKITNSPGIKCDAQQKSIFQQA